MLGMKTSESLPLSSVGSQPNNGNEYVIGVMMGILIGHCGKERRGI